MSAASKELKSIISSFVLEVWRTTTSQDSSPQACMLSPHSMRLHAQFSRITAVARLCFSIRQLQLSEYTCQWENRITGRSMSYPGAIGGTVPISTSGNRASSGWPLYFTSNTKLCLGIRERCRAKSEEKLHLCTFRIWCTWSLHKLDAQWRSCLRWFQRKAAAADLLFPAYTPGKSPKPAQNAKSNPIWWNVYMRVMQLSIE